ncbi:pyridoxamine 5'-phosphate oxidase family protein [Desulfobulbus alkaliphilus]|uniref:pyridoxamine 5'-phosphate oxidase family protein n=1 Tax=Desulfobulbus alkaliphilus TaxID=869814 RepID=UPI0019651BB5|nr:pyridoxamine 5'-phosphate oxidase family protein [Desulfobulbus alkaliphilus]MBM9536619.1 pyridoxamine 5'-phosphate oxidase family protein [Desulfobulbus alkaliphilus]
MQLQEYFAETQGTGILATAAVSGEVTTAIYARPHVMDDGSLTFIMRERLTYAHLKENGHANYMFIEQGPGFKGLRLFLRKLDESDDPELIASMTRRHLSPQEDVAKGPKHLVRFQVVKVVPLVGDGPAPVG